METRAGAKFKGMITVEHWRGGLMLYKGTSHNLFTAEGINKILNSTLHNDASATWYMGIIEATHAYADGDTYAIPGHTESTSYDEATREEYVEAAASGKSITNSASPAEFTISATKTIWGAFLANVNTKGDTAGGGVLLCGGLFSAQRACVNDDVLKITYTITGADDGV